MLSALAVGVFVSGLDQTAVVTVLPQVVADLEIPITRLDEAAWIVTAYLLGFTAAMPLLARAADVYGYRSLLLVACGLFGGGSWWAAEADGLWQLVAARAVQAVGGGGLVPVALAAAAVLYTGRERLLALGLIAGAAEAGAVLGPLYGAAVLETLNWRWVFWLNLPLTLLIVLLAGSRVAGGRRSRESVDWIGGALAGLALLALTVGLSGDRLDARPLALVAAAALAGAFAFRQLRSRYPLLERRLYRERAFVSANAANVLIGAALVVGLVEVPLFAVVVLDRSPTEGALMLLRFTAPIPLGALLGGWLGTRLPYSAIAAVGMAVSAAGFALLAGWDADVAEPQISLDLALAGVGFGIVLAPLAAAALAAARGGSEAVASASLTIARTIGMTVGLSALTTWGLDAFTRRTSGLPLPVRRPGESDAGYRLRLDRYETDVVDAAVWVFDRLFVVAAVLCLIAAAVALWLRPPHDLQAAE